MLCFSIDLVLMLMLMLMSLVCTRLYGNAVLFQTCQAYTACSIIYSSANWVNIVQYTCLFCYPILIVETFSFPMPTPSHIAYR